MKMLPTYPPGITSLINIELFALVTIGGVQASGQKTFAPLQTVIYRN